MIVNANSKTCNSNQKWNNKTCQCELKLIISVKKILVAIIVRVFVRILSI